MNKPKIFTLVFLLTVSSTFEVKGVRRMGCATLAAFGPVVPGLVLIVLFGVWGLVAARTILGD